MSSASKSKRDVPDELSAFLDAPHLVSSHVKNVSYFLAMSLRHGHYLFSRLSHKKPSQGIT